MPIAVTNTIAEIAEKFFCEHFNDFYDKNTYVNQFFLCFCVPVPLSPSSGAVLGRGRAGKK